MLLTRSLCTPARLRGAFGAPPSLVAFAPRSRRHRAPLAHGAGPADTVPVWLGHGVPTHSLVPSAKRWCFQIGTDALSSSISARHASNASARCEQDTATTTARSP